MAVCDLCGDRHPPSLKCQVKPGLAAALRALRAKRRPPTEADRPPLTTFPGPRIPVLPGQLGLFDDELDDDVVEDAAA